MVNVIAYVPGVAVLGPTAFCAVRVTVNVVPVLLTATGAESVVPSTVLENDAAVVLLIPEPVITTFVVCPWSIEVGAIDAAIGGELISNALASAAEVPLPSAKVKDEKPTVDVEDDWKDTTASVALSSEALKNVMPVALEVTVTVLPLLAKPDPEM